jgi:hypothetical protein
MQKIGKWAFIAGVVLAFGIAFVQFDQAYWVLAVLGLVVGVLNVTDDETQGFLIAAIALILSATSIRTVPSIGGVISTICGNLAVFIGPAMLVVSIKHLFEAAKD